jgi:hypothetical protein
MQHSQKEEPDKVSQLMETLVRVYWKRKKHLLGVRPWQGASICGLPKGADKDRERMMPIAVHRYHQFPDAFPATGLERHVRCCTNPAHHLRHAMPKTLSVNAVIRVTAPSAIGMRMEITSRQQQCPLSIPQQPQLIMDGQTHLQLFLEGTQQQFVFGRWIGHQGLLKLAIGMFFAENMSCVQDNSIKQQLQTAGQLPSIPLTTQEFFASAGSSIRATTPIKISCLFVWFVVKKVLKCSDFFA